MRIGAYIKRLRTELGLTQGQLGQRAGVSVSFLSDIETGRTDPSLRTLQAIAETFDLGAGDLLVDAGYTTRGWFEPPESEGKS